MAVVIGSAVEGQIEQGHVALAAAVIISEADCEEPFKAATIVADWELGAVPAVARKLAEDADAGTLTEAGTLRTELLSEIRTVTPPLGAAADRLTVQIPLEPEASVVGEHTSDETVTAGAGDTVTEDVEELPFAAAVTTAA